MMRTLTVSRDVSGCLPMQYWRASGALQLPPAEAVTGLVHCACASAAAPPDVYNPTLLRRAWSMMKLDSAKVVNNAKRQANATAQAALPFICEASRHNLAARVYACNILM